LGGNLLPALCFRCPGTLLGNGPHEGTQCSGKGDDDLLGLLAFGHALAIPFTEPALGLPADGVDRGGELFQTQLQVPTDLGRLPVCPGPFDQGTTRLGMAGLGHAALLPPPTTGIC
jgi:hypothetical protein